MVAAPHKKTTIIAISMGDPAGIGPEIILQALDSGKLDPDFTYRIIGDMPASALGSVHRPATAGSLTRPAAAAAAAR